MQRMFSIWLTLSVLAISISLVVVGISTPYHKGTWGEKSLIKDLLHDYEKRARPVVDGVSKEISVGNYTVQSITVEFGLALIQILQLNENEQVITVSVKSLIRWPDHHLVWNPEDYENITEITIPTSKIWIPDIALYNYADERLEERRECAARVNHNGIVEWYPMAIYKSTCPVKIKYFPYDKQNCNLRFGPWTYDSARVNMTFYERNWNLKEYVASPEWNLLSHDVMIRTRKYPCCPEIYSDMIFKIRIERQPAYYNYVLILPCFLLSSLTLVLFWLPPETPAKMVLGNYYCTNMTLVTVSTFLCLIVVNMHFRGDRRTQVPQWLRKLVIQHGARILFVNVGPPGGPPPKSPSKRNSKSGPPYQSVPPYNVPFGYYPPPYGNSAYPIPPYGLQPNAQQNAYLTTSPPTGPGGALPFGAAMPHNYAYPPGGQYQSQPPGLPHQYHQYAERSSNNPFGKNDGMTNHMIPAYRNAGDQRKSNAFCPACAGLAAVSATPINTNDGFLDADMNDASNTSSNEQPAPVHTNPNMNDPAEELAAVWTAAMNASGVKRSGNTPELDSSIGAKNRRRAAHNDQNDTPLSAEQLGAITAVRDRSMGPELETFLLECMRPRKSQRAIRAANAHWVNAQSSSCSHIKHQRQGGQGLPTSPFFNFPSPTCDDEDAGDEEDAFEDTEEEDEEEDGDDDQDEAILPRWPSNRHPMNRPDVDPDMEDSDALEMAQGLWPATIAGIAGIGDVATDDSPTHDPDNKTLDTGLISDPALIRRVRTVKRDVSEIVRCIRFMQRQNETKEKANKCVSEWRALGMVLDRLFFVIYLFALVISILVYFPRSSDDAEDHN